MRDKFKFSKNLFSIILSFFTYNERIFLRSINQQVRHWCIFSIEEEIYFKLLIQYRKLPENMNSFYNKYFVELYNNLQTYNLNNYQINEILSNFFFYTTVSPNSISLGREAIGMITILQYSLTHPYQKFFKTLIIDGPITKEIESFLSRINLYKSLTSVICGSEYYSRRDAFIPKALTIKNSVKELIIYAEITSDSMDNLCCFLETTQLLNKLVIDTNNLENSLSDKLAQSLKFNTSLTHLQLQTLSDIYMINSISSIYKLKSNLLKLDLGLNNLGKLGIIGIAECLKYNTSITHLNLQNNKLSYEGVQVLCEGLNENCTLRSLNLNTNQIKDEAFSLLFNTLLKKDCLSCLNISNNFLSTDGVRSLSNYLVQSPRLTDLDISFHTFSLEMIQIFCQAFGRSLSLKYLNLSLIFIFTEEQAIKVLLNSIYNNNSLQTLILNSNSLGDNGINILSEVLLSKPNLTNIHLLGNKITDKGIENFLSNKNIISGNKIINIKQNPITPSMEAKLKRFHGKFPEVEFIF
jgi:Ran GTPase-activating protein (RanGAP) involved in mRNA processing and transport